MTSATPSAPSRPRRRSSRMPSRSFSTNPRSAPSSRSRASPTWPARSRPPCSGWARVSTASQRISPGRARPSSVRSGEISVGLTVLAVAIGAWLVYTAVLNVALLRLLPTDAPASSGQRTRASCSAAWRTRGSRCRPEAGGHVARLGRRRQEGEGVEEHAEPGHHDHEHPGRRLEVEQRADGPQPDPDHQPPRRRIPQAEAGVGDRADEVREDPRAWSRCTIASTSASPAVVA